MTQVTFPTNIESIVPHTAHIKVNLSSETEKAEQVFGKTMSHAVSVSTVTMRHRQFILSIVFGGALLIALYTVYEIWQQRQDK